MSERLLVGSWVIHGEPEVAPLRDGGILVDAGGRVISVGPAADLARLHPSATSETFDAVLAPGFVNAHTHLELSALRGRLPRGRGFLTWLEALLRERSVLAPEKDASAIETAVNDVALSGTVAVGEVTNTLASVGPLSRSALSARVFHEIFGVDESSAQAMLEAAAEQRDAQRWCPRLRHSFAPHTLYTLVPQIARKLCDMAAQSSALTSLHYCEHEAERMYLTNGQGPMAVFFEQRRLEVSSELSSGCGGPGAAVRNAHALGAETLLVHLCDATEAELRQVLDAHNPVAVCPRSNHYIQNRKPPLAAMWAMGFRPGLGTDSLASNDDLDVLEEAAFVHREWPTLPSDWVFAMMTSFGAESLSATNLGSFTPGKRPGVVAFEHRGERPPLGPFEFVLSEPSRPRTLVVQAAEEWLDSCFRPKTHEIADSN